MGAIFNLPLGFQEIVDDLEAGLLQDSSWHCMHARGAQSLLDLLDHGLGVVALFALTALHPEPVGNPLVSMSTWLC